MAKHVRDMSLAVEIVSTINETIEEPAKETSGDIRIGVYRFMLANMTLPHPRGQVFHYIVDRQVRILVDRAVRRLKTLKIHVIEYDLSPIDVVKMLLSVFNKTQNMLDSVSVCQDSCRQESIQKYLDRLGPDSPYRSFDSLIRSPSLTDESRKSLFQHSSVDNNRYLLAHGRDTFWSL